MGKKGTKAGLQRQVAVERELLRRRGTYTNGARPTLDADRRRAEYDDHADDPDPEVDEIEQHLATARHELMQEDRAIQSGRQRVTPRPEILLITPELAPQWLAEARRLFVQFCKEQDSRWPFFSQDEINRWTVLLADSLSRKWSLLWLVVLGDRALGAIGGEILHRPCGLPRLYAAPHWFYLEPRARGHGLGRLLVRAGLAHLDEQGIQFVELLTKPGDRQWLERGWKPTYTIYAQTTAGIKEALAGNGHTTGLHLTARHVREHQER